MSEGDNAAIMKILSTLVVMGIKNGTRSSIPSRELPPKQPSYSGLEEETVRSAQGYLFSKVSRQGEPGCPSLSVTRLSYC